MINIVEVATLGNQTIFIEKNKDGGFSVYRSMHNAQLGIASPSLTSFYSETELETMYLRSIRLNIQDEMSSRIEHLSFLPHMQDIELARKLKRLIAFEALGREPEDLQRMIDMLEDPAPMPMLPDDDLERLPGDKETVVINDWERGL